MSIIVKVDCTHNDQGAWCNNKNVKRSLWGFGARTCPLHEKFYGKCEYQNSCQKPKSNPPKDEYKKEIRNSSYLLPSNPS